MMRVLLSRAAAALVRALIARAQMPSENVLITACASVDWRSLTFTGERHQLSLHLTGEQALEGVARLSEGLNDAEFAIPGHFVADITAGTPVHCRDGSIRIDIEALTIED